MLYNGNCQIELITYQHVVRRNAVVYRVKKRHKDLVAYMGREEICVKSSRGSASRVVQKIRTHWGERKSFKKCRTCIEDAGWY